MKLLTTVVSSHQTSEMILAGQGSTKANALQEQGAGQFNNNIKHDQYTGSAFTHQDGATAIIVGPVLSNDGQPDDARSTLLPALIAEPDKADETDYSIITNAGILKAIFGVPEGLARPFICGFKGNPHGGGGKWAGTDWEADVTNTEAADQNWYFTLATFVPDSNGKYVRQKKQFAELHGIMLDDIGTKAACKSRLDAFPPSLLIETSAGNYQAVYLFDKPLTDSKKAEELIKAVIDAGLCDPGASGPLTRYGRLPAASNGKHTPPFACRLPIYHPERRYSPAQIVEGLGLKLPGAKATGLSSIPCSTAASVGMPEDDVYTPRAAENVVIAALKGRGLYKTPLGSAKHDITCPWRDEHTDSVDGGTAYFEPGEGYAIGGFKCLHGHCADRHIGALLGYLSITSQAAKHKPTINVKQGELHRVVDAAERVLSLSGRYYQRGGLIVSIVTDPGTNEVAIKEVNQSTLARALSATATCVRFDVRKKVEVIIDPPTRHISVLSDAPIYLHLPVLSGIARQPYLRPDGSLMSHSGYDRSTGMFGAFNASEFSVAESPSMADAQAALAEISTLLDEFGFPSDNDKAAALAGILTATIRPSLPQAPMFHVKAPQIASGKSYLSALISKFASPTASSALSFPNDDDECRKLLLATLLTAPAVMSFDNLTSDLTPHKSLCSALTEEYLTGRILGVSKVATVGTRALFLSSGNNVGPVRDMARRCVTIRLDPGCETPAAREFKFDPVKIVRDDRPRYVSLALTIIRAWIVAGSPTTLCKPLASYAHWSDWVRQPLLWLGLADPAQSVFDGMADDPDRETLGRLMLLWSNLFGARPMMVRDVVKAAGQSHLSSSHADLNELVTDIAGERGGINRGRLGWWISRHQGRVVDGLRFERAPRTRNAEQWRVLSVSSVTSGASPATAKSVSVGGLTPKPPSSVDVTLRSMTGRTLSEGVLDADSVQVSSGEGIPSRNAIEIGIQGGGNAQATFH